MTKSFVVRRSFGVVAFAMLALGPFARSADAQLSGDQLLQLLQQQQQLMLELQQRQADYNRQVYDQLLQRQQQMLQQRQQAYERYATELQARGTTPEAEAHKAYYESLSKTEKRAFDLKVKRLQRIEKIRQEREARVQKATGAPPPPAKD